MADFAVGAFGAVAGSMIPGVGWMMGLSFGTTLGGLLFPPDLGVQESGKATDTKLTVSSQGAPIPHCFGIDTVGGNIIWTSSRRETVTTDSGEGGGSGGPTYTSKEYHYDIDLAILVHDGEIDGYRRIKTGSGNVILDSRGGSDIWADEINPDDVYLYRGTTSQLPNEVMEAALGVGNVPAYRRYAYVVFKNFNLDPYGGDVPQFVFEIDAGDCSCQVISEYICEKCDLEPTQYDFSAVGGADYQFRGFTIGSPTEGREVIDTPLSVPFFYDLLELEGQITAVPMGQTIRPRSSYFPVGLEHNLRVADNAEVSVIGADFWVSCWTEVTPGALGMIVDIMSKLTGPANGSWMLRGSAADKVQLQVVDGGAIVNLFSTHSYDTPYEKVFIYAEYKHATKTIKLVVNNNDTNSVVLTTGIVGPDTSALKVGYRGASVATVERVDEVYIGKTLLTDLEIKTLYNRGYGIRYEDLLPSMKAKVTVAWGLDEKSGNRNPKVGTSVLVPYVTNTIDATNQVGYSYAIGGYPNRIHEGDMGVVKDGYPTGETITTTRKQDVELPTSVVVHYISEAQDFQSFAQGDNRSDKTVTPPVDISLAFVLSDYQAKIIARKMLYYKWATRVSGNFQTGWRYLRYGPTDVITVEEHGQSKMFKIMNTPSQLCYGPTTFNVLSEDPDVYNQTVTAYSGSSDGTVTVSGQPEVLIADTNAVIDRDADYIGYYGAASSLRLAWPGAKVTAFPRLRNADGELTDTPFKFGSVATLGVALTTLPSGPTAVWDDVSFVDVEVHRGTLTSADTDLDVLNGANMIVLGYEIFQFKTATPLGGNQYRLSRLIRGRRGTEYAVDDHFVGEEWSLVNSAGKRFNADIGQKGKVVDFTTLEFNRHYSVMPTPETIPLVGRSRMPYSVADLKGTRDGGNNLTMTWKRRVRKDGDLVDYYDAPLDESSEKYDLIIYTDNSYSTIKRKRSWTVVSGETANGLSSPTYTYTSADQITDFGSNQAVVYVEVYQYSDKIGRGFVKRGEL